MWALIEHGDRSEIVPLTPAGFAHAEYLHDTDTLILVLNAPGFGPDTDALEDRLETLETGLAAQAGTAAPLEALIGLVRELGDALSNIGPYTTVYAGETAQALWATLKQQVTTHVQPAAALATLPARVKLHTA